MNISHILPPALRRRIKRFLTFIRGRKVGTTPSTISFHIHISSGRDFQVDKTSKTSETNETSKTNEMSKTNETKMHPNIRALTQLPHPRDRTIHGDIPIYYLQVPARSVAKIRGPDAPDPLMYVTLLNY